MTAVSPYGRQPKRQRYSTKSFGGYQSGGPTIGGFATRSAKRCLPFSSNGVRREAPRLGFAQGNWQSPSGFTSLGEDWGPIPFEECGNLLEFVMISHFQQEVERYPELYTDRRSRRKKIPLTRYTSEYADSLMSSSEGRSRRAYSEPPRFPILYAININSPPSSPLSLPPPSPNTFSSPFKITDFDLSGCSSSSRHRSHSSTSGAASSGYNSGTDREDSEELRIQNLEGFGSRELDDQLWKELDEVERILNEGKDGKW